MSIKYLATKFRAGLMAPAHFLKLASLPDSVTGFWKTRMESDADASAARAGLGATATGSALFTAADAGAAQDAIGATATGKAVITAANAGAAQDAIGATATGKAVITAANAGAVRTAAGITTTGSNIVTASNQANARNALGATAVGTALFTATDVVAARNTLGIVSLDAFQNKIINGDFSIAQRGSSFASATGARYTLDRWWVEAVGSSTSVNQTSVGISTARTLGGVRQCMGLNVTSVTGASNRVRVVQRIESVQTFAGENITIAFWARSDGTKKMGVSLTQNFGTGGSPSTAVQSHVGVANLTSNWALYTFTFAVPNVDSKTIGSNGNDCLEIIFWVDAGSSFNAQSGSIGHQSGLFYLAKVMVAKGDYTNDPDPFEYRPETIERLLCERYFQLSKMWPAVWFNQTTPTATCTSGFTFDVPMRSSPSVIVQPSAYVLEPGVAGRNIASMATAISATGGQVDINTATPTASGKMGFVQPGGIWLDAEL